MPKRPYLSAQENRQQIEGALRETGGDVALAAQRLGMALPAFYQKSRRSGVNLPVLVAVVRGEVPGLAPVASAPTGDAQLAGDGTITLSLVDYALLRAGSLAETTRLHGELATADRIIAALTRQVEAFARSAGARAALVLWALLVLPAVASAQPAPNRYDAVAKVDAACPGLVRNDHAFTDAVASVLFAEDARWGRNGKRGNAGDPSHDALAFVNPEAARTGGVSIVDIIVAAGGPGARPAWQDVTQATINAGTVGVWVRPSGVLPACLSGGSGPAPDPQPPPVVVPPTPAPSPVDLSPVLAKLDAIAARLAAIEAREPAAPDLGLLNTYIDQMIGNGPGEGMPNHVNNLTQRLEVIRVQLEQLDAWLRGRRVLRY